MDRQREYVIATVDIDGSEYVSDDVLNALDVRLHLDLQGALLILGGWKVRRCQCGLSLRATKGDMEQMVVAIPLTDLTDLGLTLGLALGLLAPASLDGRLGVAI